MFTKRHILLYGIFSLLTLPLFAQTHPHGLPWIQNYHFSETGGSEQNWCITQDFRGVIYVGNHNNGVLEYDGSNWRTLPVPGEAPVRSLASGVDGHIYVGLEGGFGRLEPDLNGKMHFRSLADSAIISDISDLSIWKTYYQEGKVYFCGQEAIFVFDPDSETTSIIETPEVGFLSFFVDNTLYTGDYLSGLMKYEAGSYAVVPGGEFFHKMNISGLVPYEDSWFLVATFNRGLFLLDPQNGNIDSTLISPELKQELINHTVVHLQIHRNKIFVGTLLGGLYILNRQGELEEIISEREGLLDNAITWLFVPRAEKGSNSIWIAHWKGVSRVDIFSPFRATSVGQSIMGMGGRNTGELITDIIKYQNRHYISTLGGILYQSDRPDRPGFRPVRGIREEIFDLQVLEPVPGVKFLVAAGQSLTYVIDEDMKIQRLETPGRKILADPDNPGIFYTGQKVFTGFTYDRGQWKTLLEIELSRPALEMCLDKMAYFWIGSYTGLYRLEIPENGETRIISFDGDTGLPEEEHLRLFTDPESGDLLVGTNRGFYHYHYQNGNFFYDSLYNSILPEGDNEIMTFHRGADDQYWFSFENEHRGWSILGAKGDRNGFEVLYDRAFRLLSGVASTDVFFTDDEDELWFSKSNQLFHFDPSMVTEEKEDFQVLIRNAEISDDSVLFHGANYTIDANGQLKPHREQSQHLQPDLKYHHRDIEFRWSSPYYRNERQIRYSYMLEGFSNSWSNWGRSRSAKFTNLPHGRYNMQVKARNIYGEESPPVSYVFTILRPWYATFLAISLYIILIATLTIFIVLYTRNLKRKAELLERQNREIELQKKELENLNEEITAQRDEIEAQRDSISEQKELINQQKNAMTDSIHYARRIQDAVLPAKEVMRFLLPKHFVFYRPRDIVSGDFFWVDKKDETIWIAVADCTGHGVPGAFMSMLGISLLNEISSKYSGRPTNDIMDELRDQVIASLGQTGDRYEAKDGMEMALVAINTQTREIQFTGAMQNLYTFQKGKLVTVKGDRMPVGIHIEGSTMFSVQNIQLDRGDTLYLFSDGYADQFGGDQRKKFGGTRLKKLLADLQKNIMHDQKEAVKKEFDLWKGDHEQIDDVLMIGIKL